MRKKVELLRDRVDEGTGGGTEWKTDRQKERDSLMGGM